MSKIELDRDILWEGMKFLYELGRHTPCPKEHMIVCSSASDLHKQANIYYLVDNDKISYEEAQKKVESEDYKFIPFNIFASTKDDTWLSMWENKIKELEEFYPDKKENLDKDLVKNLNKYRELLSYGIQDVIICDTYCFVWVKGDNSHE